MFFLSFFFSSIPEDPRRSQKLILVFVQRDGLCLNINETIGQSAFRDRSDIRWRWNLQRALNSIFCVTYGIENKN